MSAISLSAARTCRGVFQATIRPSFIAFIANNGYVTSVGSFTSGTNMCPHSRVTVAMRSFTSQPHNPKVPQFPAWQPVRDEQLPQPASIPADLVDKLERLALVDFRTQQGLTCLKNAVRFADQLHVVDTSGAEPMDSVLEDRALDLRDDLGVEGDCAEKLLQLSKNTVEEYFVAPPGNIPLPRREERAAMLKHSDLGATVDQW